MEEAPKPAGEAPKPDDLLWKQYCLHVDLYKFYLEIAMKVNVFYYAITGGILSFYFNNIDQELAKYALILPAIMSAAFGILFLVGSAMIIATRREVFNIRDKLKLETAPELGVLFLFLLSFGVIFIGVSCGIWWVLAR
jgi:hypothetical protein